MTKHPYAEGLLIPTASTTYRFSVANLPEVIQGQLDVGTWLGMSLMFAFTQTIALFGIDLNGLPEDADAIGCLGTAVDAAQLGDTPSVGAIAAMAKAVLSCIGPLGYAVAGSLAGVIIGAISSGVGLIVGGLEGAVLTATSRNTFTIPVTARWTGGVTKIVRVRPVDAQED